MTMVEILLNFIRYDRLRSFKGNLAYLQKMLPYWAATWHNLYLNTGWLYLQSMQQLLSWTVMNQLSIKTSLMGGAPQGSLPELCQKYLQTN